MDKLIEHKLFFNKPWTSQHEQKPATIGLCAKTYNWFMCQNIQLVYVPKHTISLCAKTYNWFMCQNIQLVYVPKHTIGLCAKTYNWFKKCTFVQALRLCTGRTAHRGAEVYLSSFMTTALEGSEGSASSPGRSLPPGKTRYLLYRRLGGT